MIKKLLTYSVVVTTVVWSVGLLATPLAVGAVSSGDLIKLQCAAGAGVNDPCKAVYYLGADAKRYVFPNEKTYKTWYSDFSSVQIVSATEMSSYTIGGNATYRPGVKLVKITTDPKVYAVAGDGTLMWVTTAALAETLYGAGWATSMVEDIPDAFFVNYTVGSDIDAAADYDKDAQTTASPTINDDKNLVLGGVSTGTGLTVALAADTPASGVILGNSINNKFTKIDLTASSDGDIVVDQVVVRRGGTVASDNAFSSIALIEVATNTRIGNTKSVNSEHRAVFNKDFTVAAGTTKSIYLAGNMASSLASYAGEIPSLDLYSITLGGGAAVIGTVPIVGNHQTLNGTVTVGALSLSNGSNNPDASTQKIGTTNYIVAGFKLVANSVEDFKVTQIGWDQGGTADDDDVSNLDLLVDDEIVATISNSTDGSVVFDLSAIPVTIGKGKTVQFDLQIDIADGSNRTIRFDVKDESDVVARGQTYGAEVKVADGGDGAVTDADPFWTAPVATIDRGALRIGPATLEAVNIPEDADQIVLGKFEFEAKGEPVEITALPVHFLITTSTGTLYTDSLVDLVNVTVYDEDGQIVAGPDDPTHKDFEVGATKTQQLGVTTTDTITVPVGTHYYTVKADLNTDFGSDDTIVVHIKPDQLTAKGETTGLAVTPTPGTEQDSATMTVKTAALALSTSRTPIAGTIVAGTQGHTFANILLGAESSGEDVKVTKIKVAVHSDSNANPAEVSNWSIYDGDTELSVTNDPDSITSTKTTNDQEATSTFTFTTPLVITKGTSKTLTIKGNISSAATNGSVTVGMSDPTTANHITAKGNDTGVDAAVTISVSDGQAQTFSATGTLTVTQDPSTPDASYIPANTDGITLAVLNATARYEDVNVEKIYVTGTKVNAGGWDQIETLHLYNGSTLVKSVTPTSSDGTDKTALFDMTNDPLVVPKDTSAALTFKADTPVLNYELNSDGAGLPSSLEGIKITITAAGDITAKGAESGTTLATASKPTSGANGNNMYLVKSMPTISLSEAGGSFPASTVSRDLHSFTITADEAGKIGLFSVSYEVSTSSATVTDLYLYEGSSRVGTLSTTDLLTSYSDGSSPEWKSIMTLVLTTDDAVVGNYPDSNNTLPSESVIAAGSSRTFTLKGTIECGDGCLGATNTGSVLIRFLGDSSIISSSAAGKASDWLANQDTYDYEYSLLWTDFWRTPLLGRGSTTATATEQWMNAYLVTTPSGDNLQSTSTGATWSKAAQ